MKCGRFYLTPLCLGLSLLLLLISGTHYELYQRWQDDYILYQLAEQVAELLGAALVWGSTLILFRRIPLPILTLFSCLTYAGVTNVYITQTYWLGLLILFVRNASKSLLAILFTHQVASAAEQLAKDDEKKRKTLLQTFFAIFYGVYHNVYIFVGCFNLYLFNDSLKLSAILSRSQLTANATGSITYCGTGNSTCFSFYSPRQLTEFNFTQTQPVAGYIHESTIAVALTYAIIGAVTAVFAACYTYFLVKWALPTYEAKTRSICTMIADLKFTFLIPSMVYSGIIEGYVFFDVIKLNTECYGYIAHHELTVICYGCSGVFVCCLLFLISGHINRVLRITSTSLLQVFVIILLIVYPGRISHVTVFYLTMTLLAACVVLWHTQLSALVADLEPKRMLQGYCNFFLFHSLGRAIAFVTSAYLCMNTRLYFLLGSAILAQFLYLANEVELRIYAISLKRGKSRTFLRQPPPINVKSQPTFHVPTAKTNGDCPEASPMLPASPQVTDEHEEANGAGKCDDVQ